ncbi:unnamed protein product [Moneuplotes crassus]|uniref:P-type phospholipid transporter n=1 Tax=Euplotes crassus TaxID=5936 RepID=A0AAD1X2U5_EUPCR|nr:unnamed protein product [Moneuplotes crassus]
MPDIKAYRNIFYGFDEDDALHHLKKEYEDPNDPKQKIKIPKYKNNKISTSKYNIVDFLPKAILIQFLRIYNFYFLCTIVLQGVPAVSTMPVYLAALPFIFVIGVSVFREFIEEIKRRKQDRAVNNSKARVLRGNKFHECKWRDLQVGDIIFVHEDETFPADLLLLACSDHYGTAYIQTMTLDGERALKPRQAYTEFLEKMKKRGVGLDKLMMHLKCENPNTKIYQFEGQLTCENPKIPLMKTTLDQFLLRGAVLSNTDWIIGMVVYAGHDTKLLKNLGKNKYKQTHIEKRLNKVVIFLILFQTALCLMISFLAANYNQRNGITTNSEDEAEGSIYLFKDPSSSNTNVLLDALLGFLKFFLLLSSILPISLLVSLEVIKVLQSMFIFGDPKMFSVSINQSCKVMSVSLNEELGCINNIFTDKTGTLTSNEMIFKACCIGKVKYDKKSIEHYQIETPSVESNSVNDKNSANDDFNPDFDNSDDNGENVLRCMKKIITLNYNDEEVTNEYRFGNIRITKQTDFLHYFWTALSLCHEVISISKDKQKLNKEHFDDLFLADDEVEDASKSHSKIIKKRTFDNKPKKTCTVTEDKPNDDFKVGVNNKFFKDSQGSDSLREEMKVEEIEEDKHIENDDFSISERNIDADEELIYHGMSPDEITLVDAAKRVGYEFRYRSNNEIEIKIGGQRRVFRLLEMFKFTSERKRMTVVVQDPEDPEFVIVFTKGADNIMKGLSANQYEAHFDFSAIGKFANKGYRTLLIGMKVIKYDEFLIWKDAYDIRNNDIENDHEEELNELIHSIENELFLLGTTALEDKLQEDVHECIEEFRRADIKVWMITGDKLETAENVGISCRLLHEDARRFHFVSKEMKQAKQIAKSTYREMKRLIKQNNDAREIPLPAEESEDSEDLERGESENQLEVAEEDNKVCESSGKNMNTSFHTHHYSGNTNRMNANKLTIHDENASSNDLFAPDKQLKITEKKLFVKQIILKSSLGTSFNVNKIATAPVADINFEIVIEGDCLALMFHEENRKLFGKIIKKANVVLVCRSSPKQKAEVVEFAKEVNPKMVSLAIGDGGNDVSMIKEADVGIGIFGKEGYQAVSASDYAIGEFQFLRRLMFIHGRFNTRRMTMFITQFLLKNLIFSISQLSFAFFSAYSGQTFFEAGYTSIFNTFATQLMVCACAVADIDINPNLKDKTTKLLLPYLYAETRDHLSFNITNFVTWYFYGLGVGAMNFFVSYYSYLNAVEVGGKSFGLWQFSFTTYIAVVATHLGFIAIYIGAWNWIVVFVFALHIVIFYPGWAFAYNELPGTHITGNQLEFYNHLNFWLIVFVIAVCAILPIAFIKQGKSMFFPRLIDLIMRKKIHKEIDIENKLKIDIVKLEKELDSENDDDQSVRMSQGLANQVRTSHHGTIENINKGGLSSAQSEIDSINDSKFGDDDFGSAAGASGMNRSHHHVKSTSSLAKSQSVNSTKKYRLAQSVRKDHANASPTFQKFSGNMLELRANASRNSDTSSQSRKKMRKSNRGAFGNRKKTDHQFHPQLSSVGGHTIQEKSDEEDKEESSLNSRINENQDNESCSEDNSSEGREESSSEKPSQSDVDNKYSIEASSITEPGVFGRKNHRSQILDNMGSQFQNRKSLEVSDLDDESP